MSSYVKKFKKLTMIAGAAALFVSQYVSAENKLANLMDDLPSPIDNFISMDSSLSDSDRVIALCSHCTEFQMQTEALKAAAVGGKAHVVDIKTGKVSAYQVTRDNNVATISEVDVNPQIKKSADGALAAVKTINAIITRPIDFSSIESEVTSAEINTAYQLEVSSFLKSQVTRALTRTLWEKALTKIKPASLSGELVYAGTAPTEHPFQIIRVVQVVFPDETTYEFKFKGIQAYNGKELSGFEPRIGSGKDGSIDIPIELGYSSYYQASGSEEAINRTVKWMQFKGIAVSTVPGGTKVTCSELERSLTCEVQK